MHAHLENLIEKLTSSQVVDKARLIIRPMDLVDKGSQLSVLKSNGEGGRDVVAKCLLSKQSPKVTCLRCGGKSEVGRDAGHISFRWRMWEKMWATRCVCGGRWLTQFAS